MRATRQGGRDVRRPLGQARAPMPNSGSSTSLAVVGWRPAVAARWRAMRGAAKRAPAAKRISGPKLKAVAGPVR